MYIADISKQINITPDTDLIMGFCDRLGPVPQMQLVVSYLTENNKPDSLLLGWGKWSLFGRCALQAYMWFYYPLNFKVVTSVLQA